MASKKKVQVVDEVPVTAPLFVKHHYIIIESADNELFYVDRNAAITSRVVAAALKELGNRADEEVDDLHDDIAAAASASSSRTKSSFLILGGDVEVKCNGEKAANAAAQLPIVHPSTLMAAAVAQHRPATGDGVGAAGKAGGGGASSNAKSLGSKAAQQLLAQQELLAQQLVQYQQVDAAVNAMSELPVTHLRLAHINGSMLELAVRFMYYKYKNDTITEAELRQGFFAFVSERSHPPQSSAATNGYGGMFAMAASFGGFGEAGRGGFTSAAGFSSASPTKQRKSTVASAAAASLAAAASASGGSSFDPITGGGVAQLPTVGSQSHMELLAVSMLLQL